MVENGKKQTLQRVGYFREKARSPFLMKWDLSGVEWARSGKNDGMCRILIVFLFEFKA